MSNFLFASSASSAGRSSWDGGVYQQLLNNTIVAKRSYTTGGHRHDSKQVVSVNRHKRVLFISSTVKSAPVFFPVTVSIIQSTIKEKRAKVA